MTSSRPYSRTTCSYIASTCASSARSACTASRPTECPAWSTPTTTPPSLANRPATARPITLPAPLTTQTLPASRFTDSSRPLESRPDHPTIMGASDRLGVTIVAPGLGSSAARMRLCFEGSAATDRDTLFGDPYQPSREPLWLVAAYSTVTVWM